MREVRRSAISHVKSVGCAGSSGTTPRIADSVEGEDDKLFYAVGSFTMKGNGYYYDDDRCFCGRWLTIRFDMIDTYDWDQIDTVFPGGVRVPDSYALELEQCDSQHPKPFNMGDTWQEEFGCVPCR